MELFRQRDLERCGIYMIVNKINNKVYIGKTVNIYERIRQHINTLNKKSKNANIHLINAWFKYGRDNFRYEVLEYTEDNDDILKERELFYMKKFNSTDRNFGYNLRLDTSTNCILPEETKKRMSEGTKQYYIDHPEAKDVIGKANSLFWKNNPEIKKEMARKVSEKMLKYKIEQYSHDKKILIKVWNSVQDIIRENPTYKWQNIYSVCNGYKKKIYGYVWCKIKI